MDTITGIGSMNLLLNSTKQNIITVTFLFLFLLIVNGCDKKESNENSITPRAIVTVTTVKHENISDTVFFQASSVFNKKTSVEAPVTGYVMQVYTAPGSNVTKGYNIFVMETKEYHALFSSGEHVDSNSIRSLLGKISINSPVTGQVSDLSVQAGSYVQEGTSLCTIVNTSDLYFNLYVPVEYGAYAGVGKLCTILLPNGQTISGRMTSLLSKTESNSQTETFLVKPGKELMMPEGINVKAFVIAQQRNETQLLPANAVLSNETLNKFWIMKLINDSTAVKVQIRKGLTTGDMIEILEPQLNENDKIILTGNYGLPDTALVMIGENVDGK